MQEEELNKSNLRVLREKVISRPAQPTPSIAEGSGTELNASPNFTIVAKDSDSLNKNGTVSNKDASTLPSHAAESVSSETFSHSSPAVEVHSINQTLREQIELLKEERNWLRERLEQLENRTQRDQMLLLSESETIRNLVLQNRPKRFFGLSLPWFGKE